MESLKQYRIAQRYVFTVIIIRYTPCTQLDNHKCACNGKNKYCEQIHSRSPPPAIYFRKWEQFVYIISYWNKFGLYHDWMAGLHIGTNLPAAWLRSGSNFDQLCSHTTVDRIVRSLWVAFTSIYIYLCHIAYSWQIRLPAELPHGGWCFIYSIQCHQITS